MLESVFLLHITSSRESRVSFARFFFLLIILKVQSPSSLQAQTDVSGLISLFPNDVAVSVLDNSEKIATPPYLHFTPTALPPSF